MNKEDKIRKEASLEFYNKLLKKIEKVKNNELDIDEWQSEIMDKIINIEKEICDFEEGDLYNID
jgi:uncharacterized protein Yka (UPF0111/DUF47 family)